MSLVRLLLVAAVIGGRGLAAADNVEQAQVLYDEGQRLIDAGKIDEACEKFETSLRLDPAIGTKLNLADCRQRQGRAAAAHRLYKEAGDEAVRSGKDAHATFARQHLDLLARKVVRIKIRLAEPDVAGLAVILQTGADRRPLSRPEWSEPLVVDPGPVSLEITAPGRAPYRANRVGAGGVDVTFEVPALIVDENPIPRHPRRSLTPFIVGGAGGALLLGSVILGLSAKSAYDDAVAEMAPDVNARIDSAQRRADIATGLALVGAVGVTAGVVLYVRGRGRVAVAPSSDGHTAGVVIAGRF